MDIHHILDTAFYFDDLFACRQDKDYDLILSVYNLYFREECRLI